MSDEAARRNDGRDRPTVVNLPNPSYPNTLERIVRVLRDAMIAIAALLISMLILTAMHFVSDVADRLEQVDAPAPVTTECVGELC